MEHGVIAENILESICCNIFGCDFIMRSPITHEISGDKELTDILILIDDVMLILQSKSMLAEVREINKTILGRIAKRHSHAKTQLNTTLNAGARKAEVSGCTPLGVRYKLDWVYIKKKIGIVTLHLNDTLYSDPDARFQIPFSVEEHNGIQVHTFLLNDLMQIQDEITSAGDFLQYLELREKIWKTDGIFLLGNELDLLAVFKIRYDAIQAYLNSEIQSLTIHPGFWEEYKSGHTKEKEARASKFSKSKYLEYIIRDLHRSVPHCVTSRGITYQESASEYIRVIGKLAKLTRLERAEIGVQFEKKIEKTLTEFWGYFVFHSQLTNIAYIFLLVNNDDREGRVSFMTAIAEQVARRLNCKELVGIATAGAKMKTSCIDAAVFDLDFLRNAEPDPEIPDLLSKAYEMKRTNEWDS